MTKWAAIHRFTLVFWVSFVACFSTPLSLSAMDELQFTAQEKAWLEGHRNIRIGTSDNPPLSFMDNSGSLSGVSAEYLKLISERTGLVFEADFYVWPELMKQAKSRGIDVFSGLQNPDREKFLNFSTPYYQVSYVTVDRLEAPYLSDFSILNGKRVAVVRNWTVHKLLLNAFPKVQVVPFDTVTEALTAVSTRRVEAYVGELLTASYQIQKNVLTNLKIAGPAPFEGDSVGFAVRKDWPELVSIFDKTIRSMSHDERVGITQKWLLVHFEKGDDWSLVWRWSGSVAGFLSLIIIGTIIWNRRLSASVNARTQELFESENRLRTVLDNSPVPLTISRLSDGLFRYANPAADELFGVEIGETVGRKCRELYVNSGDGAPMMELLQRDGKIQDYEALIHQINGSTLWVIINGRISTFEEEDVLIAGFVDLTERKLAEGQADKKAAEEIALGTLLHLSLQESSMGEYLQCCIEELQGAVPWLKLLPSGGIFLVEPSDEGKVLRLVANHNLAPEIATLCSRVNFGQCHCGRAAQLREIQFAECVDERHEITYEGISQHGHYSVPILHEDSVLGVLVLYLPHGHPKEEHSIIFLKRVANVLSMGISSRQTALTLKDTEERFRSISKSSSIAMIMAVDESGSFITWNPAAEKAFGYSEEEMLGRPLIEIIPERFRGDHQHGFKRAVETENYHIIGETVKLVGLRRDGSEFPIEFSLGMWKQGGKKYFSAIVLDITAREQDQAQLLEAKDVAEKANAAKSEFLASMSHELRTPLNAVLGFAQMLQINPKAPLAPIQEDHVQNILDGGNHLLELVNDILDLAKIEANQLDLSVQEINVREILSDCISLTVPLGAAREIKFINQFSNGSTIHLRADPLRLKQILLNLLSNAAKFNKEGGTVSVNGQETKEGFLSISVTDSGSGIDEKDHPDIFKMFHRINADPLIAREGTGIGLAVSKLLVERMAGRIGFKSEKDVGSTFWIELPLASNKDVMIWTDDLSIGIDALDKDHQFIITLLNRITHGVIDAEELNEDVAELVDYTGYHFRREEVVMEACGYQDLKHHREAHVALALKISDLSANWFQDRTPYHLHQLRNLLFDHIIDVDMQMARCAKGKKQEIRKALAAL